MSNTYYSIYEENRKQFVYFSGWEVCFSDYPKSSGVFFDLSKVEHYMHRAVDSFDETIRRNEEKVAKARQSYHEQLNNPHSSSLAKANTKSYMESTIAFHDMLVKRMKEAQQKCSFRVAEVSYKVL